jgi:hypothetical protein
MCKYKVSYKNINNNTYHKLFQTFKEAKKFYQKLKNIKYCRSIFIYVID